MFFFRFGAVLYVSFNALKTVALVTVRVSVPQKARQLSSKILFQNGWNGKKLANLDLSAKWPL